MDKPNKCYSCEKLFDNRKKQREKIPQSGNIRGICIDVFDVKC